MKHKLEYRKWYVGFVFYKRIQISSNNFLYFTN